MANTDFTANVGQKSTKVVDITGQVFGRLTVISYAGLNKWSCVCECGKEKKVRTQHLTSGNTKSCGCFRRQAASIRRETHGKSRTPEYQAWFDMIHRCSNPKNLAFHNYGRRGITVCDEWLHSFEVFHKDMGDRPACCYSIERIDNSKGYFPGNCCWATRERQNNNQRRNRQIEFQGQVKNVGQWADELNIAQPIISIRLDKLHWCVNCALTIPSVPSKKGILKTCAHKAK